MNSSYKTTPNGYTVEWSKITAKQVPVIIEDGIEFLNVYAEYTAYNRVMHIKVIINNGASANIKIGNSFTSELLNDFGINCENVNLASNSERFIECLIKITSHMKYWSKPAKNLIYKQSNQYNKYKNKDLTLDDLELGRPLHDENGSLKKLCNDLKNEVNQKIERITELEQELADMKEEIEMLKAVNQEY